MNPKISIIVPVYNVETYIRQCLESTGVLGRNDVELILVNDGSTDGCGTICQEYACKWGNVKLIEKSNGGLSDARNVGVSASRGKFIYFLDSDDWLNPDAIDTLYQFAVENNCDVVQGGFYYAYDNYLGLDNRYISEKKPAFVIERKDAMRELIKNNYIKNFAWGKLYRTEIVKRHQFPVGKCFEDAYWQHMVVADSNHYGIIPQPLYYYRQRSDSISGQLGVQALDLLAGNEERLRFIQEKFPEFTSLMADRLWHNAFLNTRYSDRDIFRDVLNRITIQYETLFTRGLKNSIVFHLAKYQSSYIRRPFLFMMRVYEYFAVKRLTRVKYSETVC
jgi:glycosyltransferase involved in cell wall biosynthesis